MKKYLVSLIPLLLTIILSVMYMLKTPKEYPDPSYPYLTAESLWALSIMWVFIGIVISASLIGMFLIGDIFDYFSKKLDERKEKD